MSEPAQIVNSTATKAASLMKTWAPVAAAPVGYMFGDFVGISGFLDALMIKSDTGPMPISGNGSRTGKTITARKKPLWINPHVVGNVDHGIIYNSTTPQRVDICYAVDVMIDFTNDEEITKVENRYNNYPIM